MAELDSDGIWRRAARDLRAHMDGWSARLLILIVDAAATATGAIWVAERADEATGLEIALGAAGGIIAGTLFAAGGLFMWHVGRAPFRQRDEARERVAQLYAEAHPEFPPHALDIKPMWYADLPSDRSDDDDKYRVVFLPFDYTNRHPTQTVNLEWEMRWSRGDGELSMGPYRVSRYTGRNIKSSLNLPLSVEPQRRVQGELSFDAQSDPWLFEFKELMRVVVKPGYRVDLEIKDQISGATIAYPVPERD
jgi:hypothetical protein